ncbi:MULTISPECIES: Asp23/Gls24 family envelope stress response protein [Holzapfeliella]|uniref:Asp23/Gls24 family envelope stress response protein n=1 Tax=Holzapfeliella saturejae TaxID=3082953 RepID=A0ABU8SGY5_9LACO
MAEDTAILLAKDGSDDQIKVNLHVLEIILGIAATKIEGVYQMRGTFGNNLNELFGRINRGKGVTIEVNEHNQLKTDVYVYLKYGVSVPQVALTLQKELTEQLKQMTDLKLDEINIHVVGLVSQKPEKIDPDALFDEEMTD